MPADFVTVDPRRAELLARRASVELVTKTTYKVSAIAKLLAPGSMKDHIRPMPSAGLGLVISYHPATTFVIYKTKPHWISARKPGGKLRFKYNGEFIYPRKVWHPGNQHPNNFLLKALEASKF